MKAWVVVPLLVIGVAAVMTTLFVHPQATPEIASTPEQTNCLAPAGPGVRGQVDVGPQKVNMVVQILPLQYGEIYLNQFRRQAGLPLANTDALGLAGLSGMVHQMRYAHVGPEGTFTCRPLDPGQYIAVATVSRMGSVGVEVAPFSVDPKDTLAAVSDNSFRPLQEFH